MPGSAPKPSTATGAALMEPVTPTEDEWGYWKDRDGHAPMSISMGGPEEGPDVIPCPCLLGHDMVLGGRVVHVAYELNEIELAALAQGGRLWLTTYGGLPIHRVEVVTKEALSGSADQQHDPGPDQCTLRANR